uniref:O-methyltransferase C-terminal domain-containing protein n=1 Tax=Fusarium oxysporum (strain Fo5176) TaxID=660025 RepID=A0A0D2YHH5_FUSOF
MASADNLIQALEGLDASSFANEAERVRALDALTLSVSRVQKPWDTVWQHCWVNPATTACAKSLIDAGVFTKWIDAGGGERTCDELAELTSTEPILIRQNLVIETAEDTYKPTPWVHALTADPALANVYGGNPTDPNDCNWQFMKGRQENLFQSLGADPVAAREFNDAMESHSKYNLTPWPEVYPTESLITGAKFDRALVVDVGGSKGHDLTKFHLRHSDIPEGSLVLQDLPDILKELTIPDTIAVCPHDFFTPQPVKGARAYFMHNVLHDWEDKQACQILKHLADAMEAGYSRLLIHESLVSSAKPLARVTTSDITMMACLAAKERTELEWIKLVESAGLRVLKIWRPLESVESIIEAELS